MQGQTQRARDRHLLGEQKEQRTRVCGEHARSTTLPPGTGLDEKHSLQVRHAISPCQSQKVLFFSNVYGAGGGRDTCCFEWMAVRRSTCYNFRSQLDCKRWGSRLMIYICAPSEKEFAGEFENSLPSWMPQRACKIQA